MTYLRPHSRGVAELGFWLLSLFLLPCFLVLRSSLCSSRSTLHLLHPTLRPGDPLEWPIYGLSCALLSGWAQPQEIRGRPGNMFPWLPPCAVHLGWWCLSTSGHCSSEGMCPFWSSATVPSSLWAWVVVTVATALALVLAPSLVLPLYPHPSANCSLANKLPDITLIWACHFLLGL